MERPVIQAGGKEPRRQHSLEFKQRLVRETLKPGASVARIARANGVNANQVFGWRKLFLEGQLGSAATPALLPVTVMPEERPEVAQRRAADVPEVSQIRIEGPRGLLTVTGCPDAATLRVVLASFLA